MESFHELLARQFEDDQVMTLMWAAFMYLILSCFSKDMAYVETLTIYGGLFFAAIISACCDYIKEY